MTAADWPAVARIYAAGIASGNATFETEVPSWERWLAARGKLPCLVAREDISGSIDRTDARPPEAAGNRGAPGDGESRVSGERDLTAAEQARDGLCDGDGAGAGVVLGWAALTPSSTRAVYRGVAAVSIYVDPERRRHGVGRLLLLALAQASEAAGLWTVEAGIFPENLASVALHESCGFRLVGVRRRVGQMADGSWRDVLLYERRSELVGVD